MFLNEKQLVSTLKDNFSMFCDWQIEGLNTYISEEVDLGFGVADLVISRIGQSIGTSVTLNRIDIAVYNTIRSVAFFSHQDLVSAMRINSSVVSKSLIKLFDQNLIEYCELGYQAKHEYKEVVSKSIAIEAKLKNWNRALNQAFRYKWFASQTYVVMDSKYIHNAINNILNFEKLNVGLAEIDTQGIIKIHFKPNDEAPYNTKMAMVLNERIKESLFASQI